MQTLYNKSLGTSYEVRDVYDVKKGATVSIDLTYEDKDGNGIDISDANITYSVYDLTREKVVTDVIVTEGVLLIPSDVTEQLEGTYILRIRIDLYGFIDIFNEGLIIKF